MTVENKDAGITVLVAGDIFLVFPLSKLGCAPSNIRGAVQVSRLLERHLSMVSRHDLLYSNVRGYQFWMYENGSPPPLR